MVNRFSLESRILRSILRTPSTLRLSSVHSYDRTFSRSFVCSTKFSNGFKAVTFGPEADAAIAPYLRKLKGGKASESKPERKRLRIEENPSTVKQSSKQDENKQDGKNRTIQSDAQGQIITSTRSVQTGERVVLATGKGQKFADADERRQLARAEVSETKDKSVTTGVIGAVKSRKDTKGKTSSQKETAAVRNPAEREQQHHTPREQWQIQKDALKKKFGGEAWNPRKKLSPDAMEGIRSLHAQDPERFNTPALSQAFKMSPEAIRRILKSKWNPSDEKMEERRERWAKRHDKIWDQQAELGLRPKRRKARQAEGPEEFEELLHQKESLGQI